MTWYGLVWLESDNIGTNSIDKDWKEILMTCGKDE